MITDTPSASATTLAIISGTPAMTSSSSSSSNSNSTSSSSSSSTSSLVTTPPIGGNSGVLAVVGGGTTVTGGGGSSNLSVTGGLNTAVASGAGGVVGTAGGAASNGSQTNCNSSLVGPITTAGGQGSANINPVIGGSQQSSQQSQQQQQQLSPIHQQPLTPQQLNPNVVPNTCTGNTGSSGNIITSNGNGTSVTTTTIPTASGANSICSTVSSLMHIKEEPNLLDTSKEDETSRHSPPNLSGISIKKEPMQRINSNGSAAAGGVIGSTNTGSLHHSDKSGNDADDRKSGVRDGSDLGSEFDTNFNIGVLTGKDDLLSDSTVGMGGLGSISNVKKEESGPDLASDGFGAISSGLSSGTGSSSINIPPVSVSCAGGHGSGRISTGNSPSEGIQPLTSNILGGGKQGMGGGGGLDYMQQQNHIFVFSTSLANKSAECVLNGQYPTIIAYHCAQPTTKKFLEDFFLKNPLKLSKMNRQSSAQWMNNSNPIMGKSNKSSNNPSNSSNNSSNSNRIVSTPKPPTSNSTGFTGGEDLSGNDTELLPWEQSGNHMNLDAMANGTGSTVNAPSNSDSAGLDVDNLVPGSPSLSGNRSCSSHMPMSSTSTGTSVHPSPTTMTTSTMGSTSPSLSGGLQPSLQGVKVPDENLTPQQRQHREEQLAKLKKMNQFLFPEQGGMAPDFVPPEGDPTGGGVPPGTKMIGSGGSSGQGPVNMIPGIPGNAQMPIGGGSIGGVSSSLRGSAGMLGMGPRGGVCRPMGPMGPGPMPDGMMGSVPPNNANMSDMSGMPCGVMMGNQQGPGGQSMVGGPPIGSMMPGAGMGQQSMVQGGPMGPGGPMNPCAIGNPMGPGMVGQNKHMMGGPGMAQMEWNKLQHQFYEERKGKSLDGMGMGGMCPNSAQNMTGGRQMPSVMRANSQGGARSQGPPPPYHQTQRSASVPIATQSPTPGSPNNPTSNLSLPSPRTGSTLSSPAGDHATPVNSGSQQQQQNSGGRQQQQSSQLQYKQDSPATNSGCGGSSAGGSQGTGNIIGPRGSLNQNSNPSTPLSSHLSPNASLKDLELSTSGANSGNQGKEPNLMPVPSPQQIQYLNTFEGQELTIQKQPNTTLKDGIISPPGGNNGPAGAAGSAANDNRMSGTSTPLTPSTMEPRFPTTPGTGVQVSAGGGGGASAGSTFPIPSSPQTPNAGGQGTSEKGQRLNTSGPSPQGSRTPSMSGDPTQGNASGMSQSAVDSVRFPSTSPGMNFSPITGSHQAGSAGSQQPVNPMKLGGFMDVSPNGKCSTSTNDTTHAGGNFCVRADNLPLNPNSSCPPPAKTSHFDPISSLAQMSQQLTSSVSSSLNGQPGGSGPGPGGGGGGGGGGGNSNVGMLGNFQNHGGMGMAPDIPMGGHHVEGLMSGLDPCGMGGVMPGMGQYGMHGSGNAGIPLGMMGGPGPRSLSPKLGTGMVGFPGGPVGMPHRMIGRPPIGASPYNGANIQVKASTPNTIQYLPARPQVGNTNPRAPPSLEFLQRFANPISMDGPPNKVPSAQGMPFYPNCNQIGQPGPGGIGMNAHLEAASSLGGADGTGMLGMGGMGPAGPMMGQNLIMRGLRPPGQGGMVRMSGPSHMGGGGSGAHHHHHHHPFSNGPPNGPNDPSMFPGNQMFSAGTKGSPMSAGGHNGPGNPNHPNQMPGGGGPPEATQPLPPTMGGGGQGPGGGAFKSSQFVGPSTADPNYAQQYHNFQQQLYATSTRSQMNNQPGGGMAGGPTNPNQSFFVPK